MIWMAGASLRSILKAPELKKDSLTSRQSRSMVTELGSSFLEYQLPGKHGKLFVGCGCCVYLLDLPKRAQAGLDGGAVVAAALGGHRLTYQRPPDSAHGACLPAPRVISSYEVSL